jgi:hypothetical protein
LVALFVHRDRATPQFDAARITDCAQRTTLDNARIAASGHAES